MYRLALFLVVLGVLFQIPPVILIFVPVVFFWVVVAAAISAAIAVFWLEWRGG